MHAPVPDLIPVEMLLLAYRSGVFPMADSREDEELYWVEPRKRAILPLDGFHCSRTLARVLKRDQYRITVDGDFAAVIAACAEPRPGHPDTWINERIARSYRNLHRHGHAHSLECWLGDRLVGGLYGVAFDRAFCGESMFSRADNASKVALAWLVVLLRRAGYRLLDCQFMTDHLASLGAMEISRTDYLIRLADAADTSRHASLPEAMDQLLEETASSSPGKFIAQSLTQTS